MQLLNKKTKSKRLYNPHTCHHILTLVTAVFFKNNLFNINQDAASKIKNHKINTTLTAVIYKYITIS